MRKLAKIVKIDELRPIAGADAIECAVIGGWSVVVKVGEYKAGDLAVYFEIDSWIPTELAPFLSKGKEPREYNGVKGERLKTIKLRGQLSQGLLLPAFHSVGDIWIVRSKNEETLIVEEGDDVTDFMHIQKWEKEIPAQLAGTMRGNFPSAIPKTDQERCQNLTKEIGVVICGMTKFEVTEKLEGSSCTFYFDLEGEFHVCSRNIDLKETDGNSFWEAARIYDVENKMRQMGLKGYAIQGELIGPGIQGNIYKLPGIEFYVFDIYNVTAGSYLKPADRRHLTDALGLDHAPVLAASAMLYDTLGIRDIEEMLTYADGYSVLNQQQLREGVVFKSVEGGMTFKAISNQYLLKEK